MQGQLQIIRVSFSLWGILLFCPSIFSANIDSLRSVLQTMPNDSSKVNTAIRIAELYEYTMPDSAMHFFSIAEDLAKQISYWNGLGKAIHYKGFVYDMKGMYAEAFLQAESAIKYYTDAGNKRSVGTCYNLMGTINIRVGRYEEAAQYILKASEIFADLNLEYELTTTYVNLSNVYESLKQYNIALQYAHQAIANSRIALDTSNLFSGYINLSVLYLKLQMPDSMLYVLKQCESLLSDRMAPHEFTLFHNNLGMYYQYIQEYDQALAEKLKSLDYARKSKVLYEIANSLLAVSEILYHKNSYNQSNRYALEALGMAESIGMEELQRKGAYIIAKNYMNTGKFEEATKWLEKHKILSENQLNETIQKNSAYLEARFRVEQKSRQIADLELLKAENLLFIGKQKSDLRLRNILLLIACVLLAFFIWFYRQLLKSKVQQQRISEQAMKIKEVEMDNVRKTAKSKLLEAALQGQEMERKRLARELHDGIGNTIVAIRLKLEQSIYSKVQNPELIQSGLAMLTYAGKEIRHMAHNLTPEILLRNELEIALQMYFDQTMALQPVNIQLQYSNAVPDTSIDIGLKTDILRILQELIVNSIKHGEADHIEVQVFIEESEIHLRVRDNGTGFDPEHLVSKGLGLKSLSDRVEKWSGAFKINSKPHQGTEVLVQLSTILAYELDLQPVLN